jgi:outer membrane protein OmpA-like peptidoglycan-associated protein
VNDTNPTKPRVLPLVASLCLAVMAPTPAKADPNEWSLQKFRPSVHSLGAFSTESARVSHNLTINAYLMANVAGDMLQDVNDDQLVDLFGTTDLVASIGLLDHLSFGFDVPLHFGKGTFLDGEELGDMSVGDIRLSLKATALKPWRIGPGLGLAVDILLPSGSGGGFARESGLAVMPKILLDAITRRVHMMTNIWLFARTSDFVPAPTSTSVVFPEHLAIGSEVGANVAAAIFLGSTDFRMLIEGRFESRLARFFEPENTALEFSWGLHWKHDSGFAVGGGASFGVLDGYGDPAWRGFLTVGYQPNALIPMPDKRPKDTDGDGLNDSVDQCPADPEDVDDFEDQDGCPEADNDKDGLPDAKDRCPNEAEDKDGDRDEDGCPDGDQDGDGLADDLDQCPTKAEDKDGFEDQDGCPEADNDKDGLLDGDDKCPNAAEDVDGDRDTDGCPDGDHDKDGLPDDLDKCPQQAEDIDAFEDEDGCPDPDNDKDGLLDGADKCPIKAEDVDGFKDEDGCPEPDNDADGLLDANDKCPDKAEDIDGCQDDDGCPEDGKVCVTKEKITISDKIFFKTGKADILPKSFALLAELATVINENPQIELIEIQGHTDDQGPDDFNLKLSDARANAVMTHLVTVGRVDPRRLQARGYGEDVPIADNKNEKGREMNRRVEFMILKQKTD